MKTLKELKNKTLPCIKKIEIDTTYPYYTNFIKQRFQPLYFDESNIIEILSVEANTTNELEIKIHIKDFTYYCFSKDESEILQSKCSHATIEYLENINRYKVKGTYFYTTCLFTLPLYETVKGEVTFRSSGDYIFSSGGNNSYGEVIKASDLIKDTDNNITGFSKKNMYEENIVYTFVNPN